MADYDDTNRGVLFKNENKEQDSHADYNGTINVGGTEYWLNAWLKTGKSGKKFMSLSVKEKKPLPKPASKNEYSSAKNGGFSNMDEDIPW